MTTKFGFSAAREIELSPTPINVAITAQESRRSAIKSAWKRYVMNGISSRLSQNHHRHNKSLDAAQSSMLAGRANGMQLK